MQNVRKASIYIFIVLLAGCVDRVDLKLGGQDNLLVVDGLITDQPGPYTVTLSRSLKYDNSGIATTYLVPEKKAQVSILVQNGGTTSKFPLSETSSGVYEINSMSFKGVVGNTYSIEIHTTDGKVYRSNPELMLATPEVDEIIPSLKVTQKLSVTTGALQDVYAFDISIVTRDPAEEVNYYRWKSHGIIEFFAFTDNASSTCYVSRSPLETQVVVSDDHLMNGNQFNKVVGIAPYERVTRFRAYVEQYSLTREAFEFWDRIRAQQESTGSIFDPAPAQIRGNVYNIEDNDETVLGYFGASSMRENAITFNRAKAANFRYPPNLIPSQYGDCLLQEFGATRIVPEGF